MSAVYEIVGGPKDGERFAFPDALVGRTLEFPWLPHQPKSDEHGDLLVGRVVYRIGYGDDHGKLFYEGTRE